MKWTAWLNCFLALAALVQMPGALAQGYIEGQIVAAGSGKPIPYVNIGFTKLAVGTVSGEDGRFTLDYNVERMPSDAVLRISCLGYSPVELTLEEIIPIRQTTIQMQPSITALSEVVVSALPVFKMEELVGYPLESSRDFAYWKDSLALGAELASRIRVNTGKRRLNTLFFNTMHNPADSLLLRINVYDFALAGAVPGNNLNKSGRNILHTLYGGARQVAVDLQPFDLWVEDDFILSLELLEVFGSDGISVTLPAVSSGGSATFRRYASQDGWEAIGAYGVGYALQTTFYTSDERKARNRRVERKLARTQSLKGGYVFYGRRGIKGALIENLNTNAETVSDHRGWYQILASPGDILRITSRAGKFKVIRVHNSSNLTVNLRQD